MASSSELDKLLQQKQADLINSTKNGGSLVKQISDAWNQAGGKETAGLQSQLGNLLTNYVAAAPTARENISNMGVFNPYTVDRLAAQQVQANYKPIADIRNELSARAQALGLATRSAQSLYNTDLQSKQQDVNFTQDAYNRAFQKEQAAQAAAERAASRRASSARSSSSSTKQSKEASKFDAAYNYAQNVYQQNQDKKNVDFWTENTFAKDLASKYSDLSPDQLNWILYEARKATWGN